jgi:NDP-4-keto-2,6-dideoxyhexose 3-C-methyltransferase
VYKEIATCRICGNPELEPLLDLGMQALTGVFPHTTDEIVPYGPLQLVKCRETDRSKTCGLTQLKHSFEASMMYGTNYGYRSGLNASMVRHLQEKAARIKKIIQFQAGDIALDIGSNDSTLLRAMDETGISLIGMDPTGIKFKEYYPAHAHLVCDFFSAARFLKETGGKKARVVTSIAMLYDLETPLEFFRGVAEVLADDGIWVFEQSYLPAMLEMTSYDTICHEHLEYYGLRQIQFMAERAGLKLLDVELNAVNGASFSITAAKANSPLPRNTAAIEELLNKEAEAAKDNAVFTAFSERVFRHRDEVQQFLEKTVRAGQKLFGYGASTKGNVILQFCEISPRQMPFIVEVNKDKFGCFTPHTKIPIISEEEGRKLKPDFFLVLPWHFRDHIISREENFVKAGGHLVFPLPTLSVY